MKIKKAALTPFVLAVLAATAAAIAWTSRRPLLEKALEAATRGPGAAPFFAGPLDFSGVDLDLRFRLSVETLTGVYQSPEGP
ncbi:MAG TPA: hypothetical protein VD713_05335, partial [Sphingomonadales bacterium]|nr:hypothetical protein [Sphingomonadales bacterium]